MTWVKDAMVKAEQYIPTLISSAAFVVAFLSLMTSILTYRRGSPRLKLQEYVNHFEGGAADSIVLKVINTGTNAIEVLDVSMEFEPWLSFKLSLGVIGISFPIRLEGYCQKDIFCSLEKIQKLYGKHPGQFKATVQMSSGHVISSEWVKLEDHFPIKRRKLKQWAWQKRCAVTAIWRRRIRPKPIFLISRQEGDVDAALIRWPREPIASPTSEVKDVGNKPIEDRCRRRRTNLDSDGRRSR